MKDDFYKNIKHKRAQSDTEQSKSKHKNKDKKDQAKADEKSREEASLKRSAKYKDRTNEPSNPFTDKVKVYFNRENFEKGKAFFAGKLSTYNERFSNELKVTKEKWEEFRNRPKNQKAAGRDGGDEDSEAVRNKGLIPMIAGGVIIIPVTLILGFVIINNFWPSNDGMELATDEQQETGEVPEAEDEELSEELEEQRFEMERRMAESRDSEEGTASENEEEEASESGEEAAVEGDLASENVEAVYSEDEISILDDIAGDAIEEKESGEDTGDAAESGEEEDTEADESTEEEAEDDAGTESAGATHTVGPDDNLYQIALRYYGSGSPENVQRIRDANGISGNGISEGQELIIP